MPHYPIVGQIDNYFPKSENNEIEKIENSRKNLEFKKTSKARRKCSVPYNRVAGTRSNTTYGTLSTHEPAVRVANRNQTENTHNGVVQSDSGLMCCEDLCLVYFSKGKPIPGKRPI